MCELGTGCKKGQRSQHGASRFPTHCCSKPTALSTKNSNCSGRSLALFWLRPQLLWGLLILLLPFLQNGDGSLFGMKRQTRQSLFILN